MRARPRIRPRSGPPRLTHSAHAPAGGTGALVLSIDFELAWGVLDRLRVEPGYAGDIIAGRCLIPRLLGLFAERRIAVTWATVGSVFADGREMWERASRELAPRLLEEHRAGPSPFDEAVGVSEREDPLHFAPSLVRRIRDTARQEVASHTFCHFECLRGPPSPETFRADLRAARRIADQFAIPLRSIVFPRNQRRPEYDAVLLEEGFTAYRGNPTDWMWRIRDPADGGRRLRRLSRGLDGYVRVTPAARSQSWTEVLEPGGLSNVRASFFLRPYSPRRAPFEGLRLARLQECMVTAARRGRILHLWWHPHNFGRHPDENVAFLDRVLDAFESCRERFGMRSLTMSDVDHIVRRDADRFAARLAAPNPAHAGRPPRSPRASSGGNDPHPVTHR